jgi:hypothetical protein
MANGSWTERLGDIDLRTPSECRIQEGTRGVGRTLEDTASRGFGIVRPRGQIPGPDQLLIQRLPRKRRWA